ncbi:hypothetical protein M5689_018511 [Euphorbia peplus]|nr:hypothetical protein M5689_018511 [Euphorbia peplus]
MMKGRIAKYDSILEYVKIIDLSSNNLSGYIPGKITRLSTLQSLNLSNNFLSGIIPEDIGVMTGLEVLDVSQNRLTGRIPVSMQNLTFLSMLNVSYKNLSGRIPGGTQFQTFPNSSFIGNDGLQGPPPIDNWSRNGNPPASVKNGNENGDEVNWELYVSIAVGFILGFWSTLLPLVLNRRWRHVYYHFIDSFWNKIWWNFRSMSVNIMFA